MAPSRRVLALFGGIALGLIGCGPDPGGGDGGPDAATLACDAPMSLDFTPSLGPANAGTLSLGIGWSEGRCALYEDENHPDVVLAIFDLEGALDTGLVAARTGRWVIASSSVGGAPTTYVTGFARGTEIELGLERGDVRLTVVFRVDADTVTLVAMSLRRV